MQLHIRVVEAAQVPSMDVVGKSDPYCVLKLSTSNQEWKTTVKDNTLMPIWNEIFSLPVSSSMNDILTVMLYDKDNVSSDDLISTIDIPVNGLTPGKVLDKWYKMNPAKGNKTGGQLRLVLHLDRIGFPEFVEH